MVQDLSKRHDWPVKKAIVDLPIRMKGSSKRTSGNSSSPLGAENKDFIDRILVCGQYKLVGLMELLVLDHVLTAFPLPRPVTIISSHS